MGIEFIRAAVAIALDEFVLADRLEKPDGDVRLVVERRERPRLVEAADDLLRPQPRDRKGGPKAFVLGRNLFAGRRRDRPGCRAESCAWPRSRAAAAASRSRGRRNRRPASPSAGGASPCGGMLSIGSTSGRPNKSAQARFTAAREKAWFSGLRDPLRPAAPAASPRRQGARLAETGRRAG